MPEYRRFIAYFYEYIDGKKGKNAGFAKVELRNGMWRILFRLTADSHPEPPVQVYGFVRERGWLLGLLMGTMRPGNAMMEEWAYHADMPLWEQRYGFSDLAGIWIRSGDGRSYVTVWDDEPIRLEDFVTELPTAPEQTPPAGQDMPVVIEMPNMPEQTPPAGADMPVEIEIPNMPEQTSPVRPDMPDETEMPNVPEQTPPAEPDVPDEIEMPNVPKEMPRAGADMPVEIEIPNIPEQTSSVRQDVPVEIEFPNVPEQTPPAESDVSAQVSMAQLSSAQKETDSSAIALSADASSASRKNPDVSTDACSAGMKDPNVSTDGRNTSRQDLNVSTDECDAGGKEFRVSAEAPHASTKPRRDRNEEGIAEAAVSAEMTADREAQADGDASSADTYIYIWKELCQRRQHFEPFEDAQFSDCIRIMPCDLMQLQQAGWQVGRSTFLLHGFYQYHHLLFGMTPDGNYVLGVPGLMNAQERYMAQMFGFTSFKTARWRDHGRQFGYWYRMLPGR